MSIIPRYVYLSPLTFLFIFFCITINKINELIILYLIVIIHELSHIVVAKYYNLDVEKISITPIGISAKISFDKQKKYNDILIYIAGPLSNVLLLGIGLLVNLYFRANSIIIDFFIIANLAIFLLNMFPVLPLDGGRIFKNILLAKLGYRKSVIVLSFTTRVCSLLFIILGIYQLLNCWYNLSLLFIGTYLYLCWYKEKEEIEYSLMRDLIYKNQNLIRNKVYSIRYLVCFDQYKVIDIIKNFVTNKYHIVKVFNKDNIIIGEIYESQMYDSIIKLGNDVTFDSAIKYYANNYCKND